MPYLIFYLLLPCCLCLTGCFCYPLPPYVHGSSDFLHLIFDRSPSFISPLFTLYLIVLFYTIFPIVRSFIFSPALPICIVVRVALVGVVIHVVLMAHVLMLLPFHPAFQNLKCIFKRKSDIKWIPILFLLFRFR